MALPVGGRADKSGNKYEQNWVIYNLLKVIQEKLSYVIIEPLGDYEDGVDLWIVYKDGKNEFQQCKARNGSKDYWQFGDINNRRLWNKWKNHLDRDNNNTASLVSPLSFTLLEDIISRALNNDNNPDDFYNIQIKESGRETTDLFDAICKQLEFDTNTNNGLNSAYQYFKKIRIRQWPDFESTEMILDIIDSLFIGNPNIVIALLRNFIVEKNIYGKPITAHMLRQYLQDNRVSFKDLAHDNRILPNIERLNREYLHSFHSFSSGTIIRKESLECWKHIKEGKSIILHGQAGAGKSGCITNIIHFCKEESIPYLAIRLDTHIPTENPQKWSQKMEFPASISHCMNSISDNKNAVIILDQLDALRWTQANSVQALNVCMELIHQINNINKDRNSKLSLVFVCRTYDLENDLDIKELFIKEDDAKNSVEWMKIKVDLLSNSDVLKIIGPSYSNLNSRIRELLRIASNLYIWENLDGSQNNENIKTTYQLVYEWKKQLENRASSKNLDSSKIINIISQITTHYDAYGRYPIPLPSLTIDVNIRDFLISSDFLIETNNSIAFTHQSIFDCFLAEQMMKKYFEGKPITDITGSIESQTPTKRYRMQIFLHEMLIYYPSDFLKIGEQMLENENIRYSFKYLYLEVLSHIPNPEECIIDFVLELLENNQWKTPVTNVIINGNSPYITQLIKNGTLDLWTEDIPETVIKLLESISPNYNKEQVQFMRKYCLSDENNSKWERCFYGNIIEGSDDFFKLKLEYFSKNTTPLNYIIFSEDFFSNPIRAIRIISSMIPLELKNNQDNSVYNGVKDSLLVHSDTFTNNYLNVLNILWPCLPTIDECSNKLEFNISDWTNNYFKKSTIKRACILIIKAATRACAKADPDKFLELYRPYMGKGYELFNEIILDGMIELGDEYADFVLNYLQEDITKNCFERSSEHRNELYYTKKLVQKYSKTCKDDTLKNFEDKIMRYVPVNQKEKLKNHYKSAKKNTNDQTEDQIKDDKKHTKYYPIWGHFQYEILKSIDSDKLSDEANNLLQVLDRNLSKSYMPYDHSADSQSGSVISPVTNKEMSAKAWMKILLNTKIGKEEKSIWSDDQNCFICNSLRDFCGSFQSYVSKNPLEIIDLLLIQNNQIRPEFIESLFFGLSLSNKLIEISSDKIEEIIRKFPINTPNFYRGICGIIEKNPNNHWSSYIINFVKEIATNDATLEKDDSILTESNNDFYSIETKALNCVRGEAIYAISKLLWANKTYYLAFKDCISNLVNDHNPVIKYATLNALCPIYNIDKEWAMNKTMKIFDDNFLMIGFPNSRKLFYYCYPKYQSTINRVIRTAMNSDDSRLLETCGYSIAEMYILCDNFIDIFDIYQNNPKLQNSISTMLIIYLSKEQYREKSKHLLLQIFNSDKTLNEQWIWGNLLDDNILDAKKDNDMISLIPSEHLQPGTFRDFSKYACKQKDIKCLANVIFEASEKMLNEDMTNPETRIIISTYLSKLISTLYYVVSSSNLKNDKTIANKCLDLWDEIYKIDFNIGSKLTNEIMKI